METLKQKRHKRGTHRWDYKMAFSRSISGQKLESINVQASAELQSFGHWRWHHLYKSTFRFLLLFFFCWLQINTHELANIHIYGIKKPL